MGLIGLLGIRGLSQGLLIAGQRTLSFATMMLYLFGISNFSGALTAVGWQLPFLAIAFSLQAGLHAQFCIENIKIEDNLLSKNILVLLMSSCSLSYTSTCYDLFVAVLGVPPVGYSDLLCLVSLSLMVRSAEFSRKLEKGQCREDKDFLTCCRKMEQFSCYSTIVFIVFLILAGFIEL